MSALETTAIQGVMASPDRVSAAAVETIHRPSPDQLLGDIGQLYSQLRGAHLSGFDETSAPQLYAFTGIALHILNPEFTPHFRDIDLVTRPQDIQRLKEIIPKLSQGPFQFITDTMKLEKVESPLFPDIESHRLSFQTLWFNDHSHPFVYEVEIWDNHRPEFIERILDEPGMPKNLPPIEKDGFKVWHPWLIAFMYQKLQDHEEALDLKQDRARHRYETMLAAQRTAHLLDQQIQ